MLVWNALTPLWVNSVAKPLDFPKPLTLSTDASTGSPTGSIPLQTVVIWQVDLYHPPLPLTQLWQWLNTHEQQRALRLQHVGKRYEFIVGRGLLRYLLGYYLACPPQHIELQYGLNGKPYVRDDSIQLQFNVSHSQGMALYAFSYPAVGIDVEPMSRKMHQPQRLYRMLCSELNSCPLNEPSFFQALSPQLQQQILLLSWVCHEAYAKVHDISVTQILGQIPFISADLLLQSIQNDALLFPQWQFITWKERQVWLGIWHWNDKERLTNWITALAREAQH